MHSRDQQSNAPPVVIRWAHWIVNGIFAVGILGSIAWLVRIRFAPPTAAYAGLGFAMLYAYALMLAVVLIIILIMHAFDARTLAYLKWPFALFAITCLVMASTR